MGPEISNEPGGNAPRERRTPRCPLIRTMAALLIGTTLAGTALVVPTLGTPVRAEQAGAGGQATAGAPPLSAPVQPGVGSFAPIVARVAPAVVNISTTQPGQAPQMVIPFSDLPPGSPFEEFFRRFFEPPQGRQGGPAPEVHALGSGFIIDPQGYVVTNDHVVGEATEISVILNDGSRYDAELVGHDPRTDLALLKIDAPAPLPYVAWGNSDTMQIGDWVVAVGNPFGLGGTVTAGILSARGRDLHAGPFDDFLQIDAPINRGNSGGPTFNMAGEVIGINTAIYSPSGGSIGIGFAIPSSLAKPVIDQLRTTGHVERGWLGVQIQPVTDELAQALGLDKPRGALVASVQPDSPAAKAGVQQGDVIVGFNGNPVQQARDLPRLVASAGPESGVDIRLWRQGSERTVRATLARMPEEQQQAAAAGERPGGGGAVQGKAPLGMALAPLDPQTRRQFEIPQGVSGVVVARIQPDSPAAETGISPGDVIVQVDQTKVTTPDQVASALRDAERQNRQSVLLLINHGGDERFVALRVAQG